MEGSLTCIWKSSAGRREVVLERVTDPGIKIFKELIANLRKIK